MPLGTAKPLAAQLLYFAFLIDVPETFDVNAKPTGKGCYEQAGVVLADRLEFIR